MDESIHSEQKKKSFWKSVFEGIGTNQKFFWTGLWFLVGFGIILIPIFIGASTGKIIFSSSFLWAFACLLSGALLGFIFGVPTIISNSPGSGQQASTGSPLTKDEIEKNNKIVQANTNLTQISDWLTKVMVGAGLVQLSKIPHFIKEISTEMAKGIEISIKQIDVDFATLFSGGIIILFSTYGFVFGYLIMRIILTEIFAE
jgi:hypothetical protein